MHVVVMGVSGAGKTTIAEGVSDRLGFVCGEADDFHPEANIAKMAAGHPLTDDDRWPWLEAINAWCHDHEARGDSTVVTCSALKRAYRDVLRRGLSVLFLHLTGTAGLITDRLDHRQGHFMPPGLLPSQFADLEPLGPDEDGVAIDIAQPTDDILTAAVRAIEAAATPDRPACANTRGV